jgi:hypothetical protein
MDVDHEARPNADWVWLDRQLRDALQIIAPKQATGKRGHRSTVDILFVFLFHKRPLKETNLAAEPRRSKPFSEPKKNSLIC